MRRLHQHRRPGELRRRGGARFRIPTEDEWYKAAYCKGGGAEAGYWEYPTQSDTMPAPDAPPGGSNSANYWDDVEHAVGAPYWRNEVGAYTSSVSAYGTFDQGGNLWEWNEALISTDHRGPRGSWWDEHGIYMSATNRDWYEPIGGSSYVGIGFRLVKPLDSQVVPEPLSMAFMGAAFLGVVGWRVRRRRRTNGGR